MAEKRRNPKTNLLEYKVRYYWTDATGKRKDSQTGWFDTEEEAKQVAERLKKEKTELAKLGKRMKKQSSIATVYSNWLVELEKKANRKTMENTTTDKVTFDRARSLWENHTPDWLKAKKTTEINVAMFRKWVAHFNEEDISGRTTREFRRIIKLFNKYLSVNNYYLETDQDIKIEIAIDRVDIKPKNAKARKRYVPTVSYINTIMLNYDSMGLEKFNNLYWYTLFTVLFFSGVRVEELVGLQWKNVHLEAKHPYLDICNAISEKERHDNVIARIKANVYHTKNDKSNRLVPILNYYYDLLETYQNRFMVEFNLDERQIDEQFVFPNIRSYKNRLDYQKQKNILRELKATIEATDLEETDCQMFRHGCAEFLITDKEHGGLGYTESEAYDYFGHASADMITQVYANLNKLQRADRTAETFKTITKHHQGIDLKGLTSVDVEVAKRVSDTKSNKNKKIATLKRMREEIKGCLKEKQEVYWYSSVEIEEMNQIKEEYAEMGIDLETLIETKIRQTKTFEQNIKDLAKKIADSEEVPNE